ncbi:TetR/AcrR family transcriptional regulator [Nonomuraea sp. NPDC049784]|uniref:TetR/AcrR family transcriptional regulator n=1 Tax=Nonomuraea sp. NPDC049784 TaxID=3154361 RepID=UPI0033D2F956
MARPKTDTRDRLLADAMFYVAMHGVGDLNMRELATALGTSSRMLVFHFGSKEALLIEIVRAVEQQQREFLERVTAENEIAPVDRLRALWRHLIDPALAPYERLFFELYGHALWGRPHAIALLDGIVESWLGPLSEIFQQAGVPAERSRQDARLAVAVARGLLLDLLATGDRAAVTSTFERFVATYEGRVEEPQR